MSFGDEHDAVLREILDEIGSRCDCEVLPPAGRPFLPDGVSLTDDLAAFYDICGGARFFVDDLGWRVCGPREFTLAAPRLLTVDIADDLRLADPDHPASTCFVFADNGGGSTDEHVVVDLHPARRGRFCETFWDRYGVPGQMPVIAVCVGDALRWLLATERGGPDAAFARWPVLGDAFD